MEGTEWVDSLFNWVFAHFEKLKGIYVKQQMGPCLAPLLGSGYFMRVTDTIILFIIMGDGLKKRFLLFIKKCKRER